jgi:hypothetical protein
MPVISSENFGLLIAYVLPGFIALWGVRPLVPGLDAWFAASPDSAPTVGGFLFITLASVAAGMLASTVRWLLLDTLHHCTGVPQPQWDFRHFPARVAAVDSLVQDHYRYYQHYGNTLVALGVVSAARLAGGSGVLTPTGGWMELAFLAVGVVLYLGSRDALRKYYERTSAILRHRAAPQPRRAVSVRTPT